LGTIQQHWADFRYIEQRQYLHYFQQYRDPDRCGTVTLSQAISNGQPILRNVDNGALINVNNLIQGSGQIGNNDLPITNQSGGVIDANGTFPLQLNNGTVTNLGLLEATSAAL